MTQAGSQFAFGSNGPNAADARVYDIATHTATTNLQPFGAFTGGVRVAACDVNADGQGDLIAGAGPGGGPVVTVFDGRSGAAIWSFFAFTNTFTGGLYVAGGDIDGDGHCDVLVGVGEGGAAELKVFSGRTQALIRDFNPFAPTFTGGVTVAAGDVDGDGHVDIVAAVASSASPEVRVFNGVTSAVIRDFYAYPPDFHGGVYDDAADVDFDGHADLITGSGPGGASLVREFSGANSSELTSFYPFSSSYTGGVRVGAGDSNADGIAEIVLATGPNATTEVKITYATSPAPDDAFIPYMLNLDGAFVAVAPRGEVIFANGFEVP